MGAPATAAANMFVRVRSERRLVPAPRMAHETYFRRVDEPARDDRAHGGL